MSRNLAIACCTLLLLAVACNDDRPVDLSDGGPGGVSTPTPFSPLQRHQYCHAAISASQFVGRTYAGGPGGETLSYADIRSAIKSSCERCHGYPTAKGGFSYVDSYDSEEKILDDGPATLPGVAAAAEGMRDALLAEIMPPKAERLKNPQAYLKLGNQLKAWIRHGKPQGTIDLSADAPDPNEWAASTDLGDCIPDAQIAGGDEAKDRFFASADRLPERLSDTDLTSLDPYLLAQTGTFAYNVEYPLWADNAEKGRWIHLPATKDRDGHWMREAIQRDPATGKFRIPQNTRFYKTFFKSVRGKDGIVRFHKIETRLIVSRTPWSTALFGSYRWDEKERSATLVQAPYRDGTPFKDLTFDYVSDETTRKTHKYALPGRQRCMDCHMGAEGANFVLGFTPLQINRRKPGEAGRVDPVGPAESTQVDRFVRYGVLAGVRGASDLPKLEALGHQKPRNAYEVRAQAYFTGNCAHCHNPEGFAMKLNDVNLNLSPGEIYGFDTTRHSIHFTASQEKRFLNPNREDLGESYLYFRISAPRSAQGLFSSMPMHTPGTPDCRVLNIVGKWVKSLKSLDAAEKLQIPCEPADNFEWVEQDFTWPHSDTYVPRRTDWNDPQNGMPERFRQLPFTAELKAFASDKLMVGFWDPKPACHFPSVTDIPSTDRRHWMFYPDGRVKQPYGEIYRTTPGAYIFSSLCAKCHGPQADGQTAFAKNLLNWSGGSVRVADLINGLFGNKGENLKTFAVTEGATDRNLAGNYLIWMGMGGTKVAFPPDASIYLGKHKAEMLNLVRETCTDYLPHKHGGADPDYYEYELYQKLCYLQNGSPTDADLQVDAHGKPMNPAARAAWEDRAAINAGWTIFYYLKQAAVGHWQPNASECEKEYSR